MTQKARPIADVGNVGGWTPTPLYPQINEVTPDDSNFVTSGTVPGNFVVRLQALSYPQSGDQKLRVRLRLASGPPPDSLTIALIEGSTIIATKDVSPGASFTTVEMDLTPSQKRRIKDYSNLHAAVYIDTDCLGGTISITKLGEDITTSTTATVSNVSTVKCDVLVAVFTFDTFTGSISPTYNGVTMIRGGSACTPGNGCTNIFYLTISADTTGDVVSTLTSQLWSRILAVYRIRGLVNPVVDHVDQFGENMGSPTTHYCWPSSANIAAHSASIATLINPSGMADGDWQDGFTQDSYYDNAHSSFIAATMSTEDQITIRPRTISATGQYGGTAITFKDG